jgi:nucleoside 2-deoxyribosyltransferase
VITLTTPLDLQPERIPMVGDPYRDRVFLAVPNYEKEFIEYNPFYEAIQEAVQTYGKKVFVPHKEIAPGTSSEERENIIRSEMGNVDLVLAHLVRSQDVESMMETGFALKRKFITFHETNSPDNRRDLGRILIKSDIFRAVDYEIEYDGLEEIIEAVREFYSSN